MRVHVLAIAIVVAAGYFVGLARWEWLLVVLAIAMVVVCEAINTAIEVACDAITEEYHPRIRDAKDIAAGAVLLSAIAASIIGLGIFVPKFFSDKL